MKGFIFILIAIGVMISRSYGEYRIWEDKKGKSIEAEYVSCMGNKVVLKMQNGKILRISKTLFSEKDQLFIALQTPPKLNLDVDVHVRPPEKALLTLHKRHQVVAVIKKANRQPYPGNLTATLLVIGKMPNHSKPVIINKQTRIFNPEEPYNMLCETKVRSSGSKRKGPFASTFPTYKSHLLCITDQAGKIIAKKGNVSGNTYNAETIIQLKRGDLLNPKNNADAPTDPQRSLIEASDPEKWLTAQNTKLSGFPTYTAAETILKIRAMDGQIRAVRLDRIPDGDFQLTIKYKLTDGILRLAVAKKNTADLTSNDDQLHELEILREDGLYTFVRDGFDVTPSSTNSRAEPQRFSFSAVVNKGGLLEIYSYEIRDP